MARLAASRDLPIDPETAVIDSLPVHDEEETAEVLGISRATVAGDWAFVRLWLFREIGGE